MKTKTFWLVVWSAVMVIACDHSYAVDWRSEIGRAAENMGRATRDFQQNVERASRDIRNTYEREWKPKIDETANRIKNEYIPQAREVVRNTGRFIEDTVKPATQKIVREIQNEIPGLREDAAKISKIAQKYGEQALISIKSACDQYGPVIGAHLTNFYDKFGNEMGEVIKRKFDEYAPEIRSIFGDTSNTTNALKASVCAWYVLNKWDADKKELVRDTVSAVMKSITVNGPNGQMNLEEFIKDSVDSRLPFLRGTDISKDPATVLTYGVIFRDTDYMFKDMKIVKTGSSSESVSLKDALYTAAGKSINGADDVLDAMEAWEEMKESASNLDADGLAASSVSFKTA